MFPAFAVTVVGSLLCCGVGIFQCSFQSVVLRHLVLAPVRSTKKLLRRRREKIRNKNRRKAIFNWAAKGLFLLRGGGGYTHSGYHKTLSATIACDRTSCETGT